MGLQEVSTMEKLYAGLDIHSDILYGTVLTQDGTVYAEKKFPNRKKALQTFSNGISSAQVKIAMEACGLWRGVYTQLTALGYDVVLSNPVQTHAIARGKKTDKVDARILADLLRTGYLPEVYIPPDDVLQLRDIARHRVRLVRLRTQVQCKVKGYLHRSGVPFPQGWKKENLEFFKETDPQIADFISIIETTTERIRRVEKEIKSIAYHKSLALLLQTVPGIAAFSSIMILGEIGTIKRFPDPKHLVSYAGLCPGIYQSSQKSYPVPKKACNTWLKWIMYICSGRAAQINRRYMKHFYKKQRKCGYPIARRSTARKMLTDVWHMLDREETYNPS